MNYNKEREIELVQELEDAMDALQHDIQAKKDAEKWIADEEKRIHELKIELEEVSGRTFAEIWLTK